MEPQAASPRSRFMLVGAPYALLAVATALCVATAAELTTGRETLAVVGVAGVLAAAHAWCVQRTQHRRPDGLTPHGAAYVGLRTCLAFVGTWINPFFAVFAVIGYFDAARHVRGRATWVVLGITAVTVAGSQSGGLPPRSAFQWIAFGGLLVLHVGLLVYFVRQDLLEEARAAEQHRTMTELAATNARLEEALAQNAALHAQLVVQAREAGAHDERERLALEIHDTIAQSLAGVLTQLQAARVGDPGTREDRLDRATRLARSALVDARRSLHDLGPAGLEETGLPATLDELAGRWSREVGVDARITVAGDEIPLHQDVATTVVRVTQEALTNVAHHAGARRVDVTLTYLDGEVLLDVRDDGRGWDGVTVPRPDSRGFGIPGMRRRAERVAGVIEVETEPGAGTVVSLRVPAVPR